MANADVVLDRKVKQKIKEPKQWKVLLLNDDHTPMDFVVGLLTEVFRRTSDESKNIMLQVHNEGSGVAGVYPFEIAESKSVEATAISRANGFPLQIKIEEE